jgi:hypothetical protein
MVSQLLKSEIRSSTRLHKTVSEKLAFLTFPFLYFALYYLVLYSTLEATRFLHIK